MIRVSWGILAREWATLGELGVKLRLCWQHGECLEHEFTDLESLDRLDARSNKFLFICFPISHMAFHKYSHSKKHNLRIHLYRHILAVCKCIHLEIY